ncbi:cysteine hydrolase family protein [Leptolyngbya sp. FACHB-261]|uniref:cysteine hydrolase family protein n=1 Tax=Leptolyngbya sp. FACHB-261 TaxID=2692806 RepID=UPI0016881F67|nr:isochorismatase family cysteine hydrolase [Leptolyngbya sp. FACHB-261]MBD2102850.1 cysteine hydrolase [Leptolyngbya sp. FACHB-261]
MTVSVGLLLIDPQNDFVRATGALSVPGAEALLPVWAELLRAARSLGLPIVGSADAHAPDDVEFANHGFPAHCLAGTAGAAYVPEAELNGPLLNFDAALPEPLSDLPRELVIAKQSFDVWDSPLTERLLDSYRNQGITAWAVAGVATDYCVKAAVLGLRARNWPVYLLTDAVEGVTQAGAQAALAEMSNAGATLTNTADFLSSLAQPVV